LTPAFNYKATLIFNTPSIPHPAKSVTAKAPIQQAQKNKDQNENTSAVVLNGKKEHLTK